MKIEWNWPETDNQGGFWVECTYEEALNGIYPSLSEKEIQISSREADYYHDDSLLEELGIDPKYKYCFIVSKDLNRILPRNPYFPFHQLWNGYSPFVRCEKREIKTLDELYIVWWKTKMDYKDKYVACLLGGAMGDELGYPVELKLYHMC